MKELSDLFRSQLLENTIPFWLDRSLDREHGGYFTYLDRRGKIFCTDKSMWAQCRGTWLYSKLCNTFGIREPWIQAARSGADFIRAHGFDDDGRMFFCCTREGSPLRKRRYLFFRGQRRQPS